MKTATGKEMSFEGTLFYNILKCIKFQKDGAKYLFHSLFVVKDFCNQFGYESKPLTPEFEKVLEGLRFLQSKRLLVITWKRVPCGGGWGFDKMYVKMNLSFDACKLAEKYIKAVEG